MATLPKRFTMAQERLAKIQKAIEPYAGPVEPLLPLERSEWVPGDCVIVNDGRDGDSIKPHDQN